jgi:hypothetical protein
MRRSIAPNTAVVSNLAGDSNHSCQPFLSKALMLLTRCQSTFHSIRYPAQTKNIYPASSTRLPSGAIAAKIVFGQMPQASPASPGWSSGKLAITQPVAIVSLFLQMIYTDD